MAQEMEADPDETRLQRAIRFGRHPLRVLALGLAAWCVLADLAAGVGLGAGILGAMVGVGAGELLARSPLRLPAAAGLLGGTLLVGLGAAWTLGAVDALVSALGTGATLRWASVLRLGTLALVTTAALRVAAQRRPSLQALEAASIVLAVSVALAAHRHGVLARPLWLSDWAWRQGLDPADVLMAIGLTAAFLSASLLLLEQRGRIGLAALPLLPVIALVAVSCLGVTGARLEPGEASPEVGEDPGEGGDVPEGPDERGRPRGPGDAGPPADAGPARRDGGGGDA
ncbi:MAG: hypothetical protein ACFCGT_08940, partial [Sandaracinaceae bacterium]